MGCPFATSQDEDTMSCTRPSTPLRNASEEGCKVLHIATLGTNLAVKSIGEEERGSVLESFTLHHKKNSARGQVFSGVQYARSRKQSRVSIPSYQRLAPGSPSESNSSSKISNLGSSSSSSPSSTSSFNETASFAVGELSPVSFTGNKGGKQAWCSPTRKGYQRCSTPSKSWDDAEMQFKSSLLKPIDSSLLGPEVLDNVAPEQATRARSSNKGHPGLSNSKYLEFDSELLDARIIHCNEGNIPHVRPVAEKCVGNVSNLPCANNPLPSQCPRKDAFEGMHGSVSFKPSLFPPLPDATPPKSKCKSMLTQSVDNSSPTLALGKHIHSGTKESSFKRKGEYCKDVGYETYKDGLLDELYASSKMKRGGLSACDMKCMNQVQGSTRRISDAHVLPPCAPGCSSAPYETDICVDTLSLQLRATSYSPIKMAKPPRSSSSHQPTHGTEKDPHSHIPISPQVKLNARHSAGTANVEIFPEKCTSTSPTPRKKNQIPTVSLDKLGANKPSTILQSYYNTHENAKSPVAPVSKIRVHEEIHRQPLVLVSDGKYTEKADAFTPHAPLLPKEHIYKEGPRPNPSLSFTSKSQWDWRSKSLGAKASIKSAVRNLEATFTGSRSLSLPKTRPRVQKEPKFESSRLLDRVFISPMRGRSSKQVGILTPIERPDKKGSEIKENGTLWRRDAKVITSNIPSHYGVPAGTIIRPLLPIGYNNVEVACKPFLPASKSVRCLPAPRGGALGVERSDSFRRKSSGLLSHPSDRLSPRMSHAQLHCSLRDGLPCYTMTMEGSEEMMLAKACWAESYSSREGCKWQYSFYSGQGRPRGMGATGWRSWIKKDTKTGSDLSGVMKVSTVSQCKAVADTKGQQPLKVLEFVLYDGKGAEVSHSQSLRFCSADKPYLLRDSTSSLSQLCSENIFPLSPTHLDMATNRQRAESLTDSVSKATTQRSASNIHKGSGGHKLSISFDAWSDSEVPDSAQASTPCSSSQVELAAMVIQLSAGGESHAFDSDYIEQSSQGWGFKFLNGVSESEVPHTISPTTAQAEESIILERNALNLSWFGPSRPYLHPKLDSLDLYTSRKQEGKREKVERENETTANHVTTMDKFQNSSSIASGRQESSGSVTLLLPTGEHSFPSSGSKGPSSLIERWRSGGLCECGGWDLGCGINVISSECAKESSRQMNISAPYDQQFSLFSQGSRPKLMLSFSPTKKGEFKLSFQGHLSHLKVFATAVAILHSHQASFMSQTLASPTPGKPAPPWPTSSNAPSMMSLSQSSTFSLSFTTASPVDTRIMIPNFKERPPRPPQNHSVAPRWSDSSSKDKISPLLAHNAT